MTGGWRDIANWGGMGGYVVMGFFLGGGGVVLLAFAEG